MLTTGPGPYLGQVQVRPAKFYVEPGRVVCLRPGRAASRPGRVLGRAHTAQPYESWRMKVSIDTTHLHYV